MRKILFTYIISCLFALASQAQQTKQDADSAYLERCRKIRESYRETGREFRAETKRDCEDQRLINFINEGIEGFKKAETNEEKDRFMLQISKKSCSQAINFYEEVIISDTSEFIRTQAMLYLGWIDAHRSIPFLLDYYQKNPHLSRHEKVRIGSTLVIWEEYDNGEKILNENCFDTSKQIVDKCVFCYQILGNESSKNYYRFMFEMSNENMKMNWIWHLVNVGDKETALPAIKTSLKEDNPNNKYDLRLLEMIGDEESIYLIKNALNDNHESVRKEAERILKTINSRTNKK